MIKIYGKNSCPSCFKAKNFCESRDLDYQYQQLGTDFTREEVLDWFPGAKTFPQIKIDDKNIGGYEQMVTYIETMNYQNINHK